MKPGRKPLKPTPEQRKQVATLIAMGLTCRQVASIVFSDKGKPISERTLRQHFGDEIRTAIPRANAAVAQSLFRMATHPTKPNVSAAIFWAKTRMRWSEINAPQRHEIAGLNWQALIGMKPGQATKDTDGDAA